MTEGKGKAQKIIERFELRLGERDGKKGFVPGKKVSKEDVTEIMSVKAEILEILEEKRRKVEERKELQLQEEITEYLKTAKNLARRLVADTGDGLDATYYICSMEEVDGKCFAPNAGGGRIYKRISLSGKTKTIEEIIKGPSASYGWDAMAWEITDEQEVKLVQESENLAKELEEARAERERKKEAKDAEIFEKMYGHLQGMSLEEIRREEREWDNLHNEGGEGYNPYRI